ncbi:hypothetical protein Csa_019952 [Cucumis sativus]|nr:hypothetical protein Csa_019952 [Cucumis sativus]
MSISQNWRKMNKSNTQNKFLRCLFRSRLVNVIIWILDEVEITADLRHNNQISQMWQEILYGIGGGRFHVRNPSVAFEKKGGES